MRRHREVAVKRGRLDSQPVTEGLVVVGRGVRPDCQGGHVCINPLATITRVKMHFEGGIVSGQDERGLNTTM